MEGFIAVMFIIAGVALWLMLKAYELKRVTQPVAKPSKQVEEICNRSAKQLGYPCYQRTVGVDSISVDTIHGLWHCDYTYNTYDRIFVGTAASLVSYKLEAVSYTHLNHLHPKSSDRNRFFGNRPVHKDKPAHTPA